MKYQECASGYMRINEIMLEMIGALDSGDKITLIKRSQSLLEGSQEFAGTLMTLANVTDEDLEAFVPSEEDDELLIREAASANQIKTAKVK